MIEVVTDLAAMGPLEGPWRELSEKRGIPTLDFEWNECAASAFAVPGELCIVTYRPRAGSVRGIAPLVVSHHGARRYLSLLSSAELGEPGGILFEDTSDLAGLLSGISSLGVPTRLLRLFGSSLEIELLRTFIKFPALSFLSDAPSSPYLSITSNWEEFDSALPSQTKQRLRRAGRLALQFGPISFESELPGPGEWEGLYETFLQVEALNWKGREGSALLSSAALRSFFEKLAGKYAKRRQIFFATLNLAKKPAAALIGVLHSGKLWILKTGYDEAFSRCSPGILLMHECVRYAHEKGYKSVEFMGKQEPWLGIWTKEAHDTRNVRIYGPSAASALSLTMDMYRVCRRKANMFREGIWT